METITKLSSISFNPRYCSNVRSWHEHMPFAYDLMKELKPNILVELGTHYGDSYFTFCQARKEHKLETLCYAIDSWEGDIHSGIYDKEVYNKVEQYNRENYRSFSQLIKSEFSEVASQFNDNSIDLLHIDGCHTYESIKKDFADWFNKVSPNGVILIHDISVRNHEFGVWKFWDEIKDQYTSHSFDHGNGLGILIKNESKKQFILGNITINLLNCEYYKKLGSNIFWQNEYELIKSKNEQLCSTLQENKDLINLLNRQNQKLSDNANIEKKRMNKYYDYLTDIMNKKIVNILLHIGYIKKLDEEIPNS